MPELRPDSVRFCPLCGDRLAREPVGPERREHPVCAGCRFVFYLAPKVVACTLPVHLADPAAPKDRTRWDARFAELEPGYRARLAAVTRPAP